MRCFIQCLSQCKVTADDLKTIFINVANIVFGQEWLAFDLDDDDDINTDDDDSEDTEIEHEETIKLKRPRDENSLRYVMPSRRSISRYLEDAS